MRRGGWVAERWRYRAAQRTRARVRTEAIAAGLASFTCPRCGMSSPNPNDIREGYCGNCRGWIRTRTSRQAVRMAAIVLPLMWLAAVTAVFGYSGNPHSWVYAVWGEAHPAQDLLTAAFGIVCAGTEGALLHRLDRG
jgi:hypothetical protein